MISGAWDSIKNVASAGMTWLAITFKKLSVPVSEAWNSMWESLGSSASSVWETVKATVVASMNWIIDKINAVINMANRVAQMGGSAIGLKIISLPTIPRLAEGGIIKARPGGMLATIGEGGQDEAVIPLNRMKDFGGGGKGITINFSGVFGKDAAEQI